MEKYDHKTIEKKWSQKWEESKLYQTSESEDKPKYYILDMFPYPSGAGLHVGHPKGYIATDIFARLKKMQGFNVLHPMGWDAFGLPAENYALKTKTHPRIATEKNVEVFKAQLGKLGFSYDWDREINSTDPKFYKWTQWIFIQLFKKGLAYESHEPINWCPSCKTGLANEDLEDGKCERCGSEIERKPMRQWVLKITEYADRMLNDLEKLPDWDESIKEMQKNWIGRKEGINIEYEVPGLDEKVKVFTTRPDTNFGATFIVAAPDSDFIVKNLDKFPEKKKVEEYINEAKKKTDLERIQDGRKKTGVFTGLFAVNTLNNKKMPLYAGDFVLSTVGTGVVVGVPGHDLRDFEFAQAMDLEVIRVVVGSDKDDAPITKPEQVQEASGVMINSDFLNGLEIHAATEKIMDYMEEKGMGQRVVNYKIQDWVFSRQRYWGEPIPIIHCEKCGAVPVLEEDLPVILPEVEHYEPTGTGESPLANITDWVNTVCPKCGGAGKRETNTMPQWAGSSWYYLRFIDPHNDKALIDKDKDKYWSPVDFYVGGAEHATRHLIYARFWHKFLFDIGVVNYEEPFTRLQHVGIILAEDGRKMSKRWGNVINPDEIVEKQGADAMRIYEMFMGPFSQSCVWNTNGLIGARKFLDRVWNLQEKIGVSDEQIDENNSILSLLHKTIKKVGNDIEGFKLNTAVSQMMILVNEMTKLKSISTEQYKLLLIILSPFAPHLTEEAWESLGENESIFKQSWPNYNEDLIKDEVIELVLQVNGKVRDKIEVNIDISEEEVKELAQANEKIKKWLEGKNIVKIVYVKGRLVNIVVS